MLTNERLKRFNNQFRLRRYEVGDKHDKLVEILQKEKDDVTLSVIAYSAEQIKSEIQKINTDSQSSQDKKESALKVEFKKVLLTADKGQAFTPEQVNEITDRYRVRSALNQDGAGHLILEDMNNGAMVIPMRGTEFALTNNGFNDLVIADGGNITMDRMPMDQLVLHLNDINRHMTAQGQPATQFDYTREQDPTGTWTPRLVKSAQTAEGSGILYGRQIDLSSDHSEAAPYGAVISNIYGFPNSSYNGPSTSHEEMLGLVNDAHTHSTTFQKAA